MAASQAQSGNWQMAGPLKSGITIADIIENFSLLDEWDDRYGYLIELGRDLIPMDPATMNDSNKVQGCVSQVWVDHRLDRSETPPVLTFTGASDAHIVSGLVAIFDLARLREDTFKKTAFY